MKKFIPLFLAALLLVAFTVPALAGNGDVEWAAKKTITITEDFTYTETANFTGVGNFIFDGEAWAKIQEQQELYSLGTQTAPIIERSATTATKRALINTSFNSGAGIANVNQAPGNLNNQGNEVAISFGGKGTPAGNVVIPPDNFEGMFCEGQVVSVQYNGIEFRANNNSPDGPILGGTRVAAANWYDTGGFTKQDSISNSFNGFTGVADVNQSAGSLNNQGNAVAIAGGVAEPGHVAQVVVKAATDVILAQANANNHMTEGTTVAAGNNTADSISTNAFGGAFGVMNVNQSSGSMNNQKNVVSIAFSGPVAR
jgi:hypothetical protein